jgi:hypothetical protein
VARTDLREREQERDDINDFVLGKQDSVGKEQSGQHVSVSQTLPCMWVFRSAIQYGTHASIILEVDKVKMEGILCTEIQKICPICR